MTYRYCLDTNVIAFALNRRRPGYAERMSEELRAGRPMLVPAIVRFELEYGYAKGDRREANRAILETLLARGFEQPAFDIEDAREAGDIRATLERQGTPIGWCDTLIAAQARRRGAVLVTANRAEFERVPGLVVVDWAA